MNFQHTISAYRFLEGKHKADTDQLNNEKECDDKSKGSQHETVLGQGAATTHKSGEKDGKADDQQDDGGTVGPVVYHQFILQIQSCLELQLLLSLTQHKHQHMARVLLDH